MPVVMHFATFLKYLTHNTADKIRDLEKYAQPGGFDFWRTSRTGVFEMSAHGRSRDEVLRDIRANAHSNGVARNERVTELVADWMERQPGSFIAPSRGVWASPNRVFSVHIEPEICIERRNGERIVVAVYPRENPRLNRDQAGAAVLLLRRSYRGRGGESFGVLDAEAGRLLRSPTNVSERLLESEITLIEAELSRILN